MGSGDTISPESLQTLSFEQMSAISCCESEREKKKVGIEDQKYQSISSIAKGNN